MKIAPSILDANFSQLQQDVDTLKTADRIHLDIMDGHYVPNLSFGASIFRALNFPCPIEAHLMVNDPEKFFDMFACLKIQGITFHIETTGESKAIKLLQKLKEQNIRAGICIDGATDSQKLSPSILKTADQVLVMSVQAGFGGQSFMPESLEKIKEIRSRGFVGEIEVDGGINLENAPNIKSAGGDIIVVGSFLIKQEASQRKQTIDQFQKI